MACINQMEGGSGNDLLIGGPGELGVQLPGVNGFSPDWIS
jgi:hypothetical protein